MSIPFVKLFFDAEDSYYRSQSNDIGLENLGSLLRDIGKNRWAGFRTDLYNDACLGLGSSTTNVAKEDDYVEIRTCIYDRKNEDYNDLPFLRLHRDELARITLEWEEFVKNRGKEMLITLEECKIIMTPTY